MNAIKVSKSNKVVKAILMATYPEWNGRKVSVKLATTYQMADYWDGGSRSYVRAFCTITGKVLDACTEAGVPMNQLAHARIGIPEDVIMVEHNIFCGKDAGVTIHVNPRNMPEVIPPNSLDQAGRERAVLAICEAVDSDATKASP